MMKVKCPHCGKFLLNVWGEEALDVMVDTGEGPRNSGQKVFLIVCPDCQEFLGIVNKIK